MAKKKKNKSNCCCSHCGHKKKKGPVEEHIQHALRTLKDELKQEFGQDIEEALCKVPKMATLEFIDFLKELAAQIPPAAVKVSVKADGQKGEKQVDLSQAAEAMLSFIQMALKNRSGKEPRRPLFF